MSFSILIVDDEPTIRLLLKDVLEDHEYTVYEAADGVAGLEQYKLLQPDSVLLDITMPRLDGLAVLQEIRRQNLVTGVLMSSALRSAPVVAKALSCGADGYLCKPFKLQFLLEEIRRVNTLVNIRRSTSLCLNCGCDENHSLPPAITQGSNYDFHTEQSICSPSEIRGLAHRDRVAHLG